MMLLNNKKREKMTKFEDSFSEEVWRTTYKHHTDNTIDDTFLRVATALASVEKEEKEQELWKSNFYNMLSNFKATTGGRIYSNAGAGFSNTTLANCFVGPDVKEDRDSLKGIMQHLDWQAKTLASEGGWGENFSYIRPRGAFIEGIGVETPGAVKFMEMFDKSSEIVTSGSGVKSKNSKAKGKIRKGAMMGVIDDWHPDVIEFITAKQTHGRLTKFNISVNFSDEFMERLKKIKRYEAMDKHRHTDIGRNIYNLDKWDLIFPDTNHHAYKAEWNGNIKEWKAKGYPVVVYNTVSVRQLWNLVMESTYNRAEPGVLFLDRANYYNPASYVETIKATNPCG